MDHNTNLIDCFSSSALCEAAKMNVSESVRIMDTEEFFILTINDQPMILKDYEFVELKRQEAVFTFE